MPQLKHDLVDIQVSAVSVVGLDRRAIIVMLTLLSQHGVLPKVYAGDDR